ncbi:hypothetical protein DXG01_014917 [Tephrocybe rancida]|nr:hypothetical protein DXG01_014917 [Tephrocybe rancida]
MAIRSWRQTALGTPRIWSRLNLEATLEGTMRSNVRKFKQGMEIWFTQSKRHPLHLRVSFARVPELKWNIIFPLPSNLQTFKLEVESADQLNGLSLDGHRRLDHLLAVDLRVVPTRRRYETALRRPLLPYAPNLRMLSLAFPDLHPGVIPTLNVPWKQITHLCLHQEVSLLAWHTILRMTPLLQRCYVGLYICDADDEEQDDEDVARLPNVTMRHLRELELAVLSPFSSMAMTGARCPRLERLAVRSSSIHNTLMGIAQPRRFCIQVALRLRHMELVRHGMDAASVLEVLKLTPELVKLKLDCAGAHDGLLHAIIVARHSKSIVPKLREFDLAILRYERSEEDTPTFSSSLFVKAVKSRWHIRRPKLAKVVLSVDTDHRGALGMTKRQLLVCVEQGLTFEAAVYEERTWKTPEVSGDSAWSRWKPQLGITG